MLATFTQAVTMRSRSRRSMAAKRCLSPTTGTGGVRGPAIGPGGGAEAGEKCYIVGTDLDIPKVSAHSTQVAAQYEF